MPTEKKLTGYPSIDKPWLKYYSEEAINAPLPECTIYEYVWQHNKEHLDEVALEYFGCKITYKKMFDHVESCAKAFKKLGIARGDSIGLCTSGVPEAVYIMLAASKIGAVANFINPLFTTESMIGRINDTQAKVMFVLDKLYANIALAIDNTCIEKVFIIPATNALPLPIRTLANLKDKQDISLKNALKSDKFMLWNEFIKRGSDYSGGTTAEYVKDSPVIMVYSSGTTGASKAIVLTNDSVNATILQYSYMIKGAKRQTSFLHIVPIWFSTGNIVCLLMPLCLGMKVILDPIFSPETFANDLAKYKPNCTLGATSLWIYAMQYKPLQKMDLSFLICPITGGEQLLPATEESINNFLKSHNCNSPLLSGYGMCELGSTATSTPLPFMNCDAEFTQGTVGIPLPLVTVSAFDTETGEELPTGERGELRASSPSSMLGYYKNTIATNEFYKTDKYGNRWGCTGDMGYVDNDGAVFVLGRCSDNFIAEDNSKVYLFDIENVILQDVAVKLCKAVAVEHNGFQVPVAHVVLDESVGNKTDVIHRINELCKAQLTACAVPFAYKIRTTFPIKPSGKRDVETLIADREDLINANGDKVEI